MHAALMNTPPTPGRLRWPVMCCALLSVAAHAVLLDAIELTARPGLHGGAPGRVSIQHRHGKSAAQAMRIRTVAMPAPARQAADEATTAAAPQDTAGAMADVAQHALPSAEDARTNDDTPQATPHAPPQDLAQDANDQAGQAEQGGHTAIGQGLDGYVPRPLLTVAPSPKAPVLLAAPGSDAGKGRHVGVLSLYIDEGGRVHHIVPDEPRLPPNYERAARDAFMAAVFTPGQQEGRIVKSRIRVEVVFDNTPL